MYDQRFVDQKPQTQKKKVNTEQQQQTKCIKMVTTPLQAILKDDNENILIIIELIVEDYLQSGKNKLNINQIIPKEAQREEIKLILSVPKPTLKRIYYCSKLGQ
ncbi:hypothetical protein RMATCC62417_15263 [Rhizopus microsporus]|nr:hypothetical protein RMATCC62417_15263 [Rhizopus microsporus]